MDETARITEPRSELIELTAEIVSAYVSNNRVVSTDLPKLISEIFGSLAQAAARASEAKEELTPAVAIKRSVKPDAITCLECGQSFKSLKRHLRAHHDLLSDDYREKWGLSHDYPMVAPNYAAVRSKMAKQAGFGGKAKGS